MIKRFHTILCVVVVLIGLNQIANAQEVSIPDPNLASAVRNAIELPQETPITQQLMLKLEHLNGSGLEITDLTGLEHATNLARMNLNTNKVSDLMPLAELTKLESLSLNSNKISDLTPLAGLTNLSALRLTNNEISDLKPLAALTRLEELFLGSNQIQSLVPLKGMTKLYELDLEFNEIRIVTPLRGLIELEELYLRENRIENINQLTALANLEVLDISGNPIADVTQVHQLIASGVDVEFDTAVPHESQVAQTNVLFNEIRNAPDNKNDWIELRNISGNDIPLNDWEISILIREDGTDIEESDIVEFPDYMLPADGVLLITNTDPSETTLLRGLNIRTPDIRTGAQHHYLVAEELILPNNTHYLLYLRSARNSNDTLEDIEDVAGTYFHDTLTADQPLTQGTAWQRTAISQVGYAVEAWGESGYQAGVGYQPTAPKDTSLGTPGYHNRTLSTDFHRGQISISEVMFTNKIGNRSVPQWIEIYNNSRTEAVNLNGWKIAVEVRNGKQNTYKEEEFQDLVVSPNQTVLVVSGTKQSLKNIPESRIYYFFAILVGDDVVPIGGTLLTSDGFFVQVLTPNGAIIDTAGNLDGDSDTQDTPLWELPSGTTENGARTSMLRRYHHLTRRPLAGTEISSWRSATDAKLGKSTYYGDRTDVGNPGYTLGGVLPVVLSHFRAEHTDVGVVLKWTTESEVDNAGFNIYRSETKDGGFKVVNPEMIQGAGTSGERTEYAWTDTTAKPNTVYYYRIEDVSLAGIREQLATVRLRGLISASGKLTTSWANLKTQN